MGGLLQQLVIPPAISEWLNREVMRSEREAQSASAQAARRNESELAQTESRLSLLYEDRLDGRIDAATFDRKAEGVRQKQAQIRGRSERGQTEPLFATSEALELVRRTSEAASQFMREIESNQSDLLRLVVQKATWKGGELRMSMKEPFQKMALSNSASATFSGRLAADEAFFDDWRRGGDSNPRYRFRPVRRFSKPLLSTTQPPLRN